MQHPSVPTRARLVMRAVRYLTGKALTIGATIFVGVFITVVLANQPTRKGLGPLESPFQATLEKQVTLAVHQAISNGAIPGTGPFGMPAQADIDALTERMRDEAGLNLPFLPRYLLWTTKALRFDWGLLDLGFGKTGSARAVILQHLPNTLLLIGTAYLLVFLLGMPLSLYLARNYGSRMDRLFAALAPVSAIPSWVFGILLITIFAFQLRWLPFGGKFDFQTPSEPIEYILVVAKHMILPVAAIVLSLLFQVVYTWRTFFIIYSEEDYVELARAKGLSWAVLQRRYILRPTLPYVITSFVTTLISFWQLSMAQEAIFQWPGLGWLYITEALPDFFGESMDPGELMIVVGIVVIFAYLLGALVFILDLVYVLIDPRILLLPTNNSMQAYARPKTKGVDWIARLRAWMKGKRPRDRTRLEGPAKRREFSWTLAVRNFERSVLDLYQRGRSFFGELRRYPSAMFGLTVILILLAGSIYAVTALPYDQIGKDYHQKRVTGRNSAPRTAMPAWFNFLREPPWLSTLIMDENSQGISMSTRTLDNGWIEKTTAFTFDYSYREIPSEIFLYLEPKTGGKPPFVSLTWTHPDGRTLELRGMAAGANSSYDFESNIRTSQLLRQSPEWKNWFVERGQYPTPAFKLLFAEPGSSEEAPQRGKYQLTLTTLLFEEDSDVEPQLVLLGQVYGLAGTDYWRRDLMVPLFWGMPFALLIGLVGTVLTTLVAMLLPAIGVWFGGWVDHLIQRLTEVNMVLPSLSVAVLVSVIFNWNIWVILGIVVVINAFGSPIKTLRSALLQAKEAPYIETARSYGASDLRIITHYLVPRVFPVLIPLVVSQVPSFIFWEATLGLFNIRSTYPSWGRIIYDGLAKGALYGSPFWVLEPLSLLLLTSLAFAMLGSALERILNPRMLDIIPIASDKTGQKPRQEKRSRPVFDRRAVTALIAVLALAVIIALFNIGRNRLGTITDSMAPVQGDAPVEAISTSTIAASTSTPTPEAASSVTEVPGSVSEAAPMPTPFPPTAAPTETPVPIEPTTTPSPTQARPVTYTLRRGEFPYCIARRFNVDPNELLALNGLAVQQPFVSGMVLNIPQTGLPFPGSRVLQPHPTTYTVTRDNETLYGIACLFGDVDPILLAQANNIPVDSVLFAGQPLTIP